MGTPWNLFQKHFLPLKPFYLPTTSIGSLILSLSEHRGRVSLSQDP